MVPLIYPLDPVRHHLKVEETEFLKNINRPTDCDFSVKMATVTKRPALMPFRKYNQRSTVAHPKF